MPNIRILPEILSNKIAAGEVVERPASVVKELIENSLDAGSTRIVIEVENGGRALIRVADNGSGMTRDDALLAIERYATSKIYEDADLFSINTLGFRGEALPSIAAVSRFLLTTRSKDNSTGTELLLEGGRIKKVSEAGAPVGTMITVKQLFFNTPARRKFLKTTATEMNHIADTVAGIALGRPDVRFTLLHNRKTVKNWPVAPDPGLRVADVLGQQIRKDLIRVEPDAGGLAISGWIAAPLNSRSTAKGIYIFVNTRLVRDRVVQHALFEGYRPRLMKGQFPVAVLYIRVPFDQVDVNVHPTKNEVRFSQQEKVHQAVKSTVSQALAAADRPRWKSSTPSEPPFDRIFSLAEPVFFFGKGKPNSGLEIKEKTETVQKELAGDQTPLWNRKRFRDLKVIGQFTGTYILCESEKELIMIDQHAAHERIVFEQLKKQSAQAKKESQKLLVPETIELGYREAEILSHLIPDLRSLGLEVEPFGGNTFVVESVPALIAGKEIPPLILEIVEKMAAIGFSPGLEGAMEECLIIMACHGTIRANQPLKESETRRLLQQLDECENPSHCPHGRPVWIQWTLQSIEKSFHRIV